jgi:hypothetical protein
MSRSSHNEAQIVDQVHALRLGVTVMMAWDASGAAPAHVRVLRSPNDSASGADDADLLRLEQTLVYEGDVTEMRDDDTIDSAPVYYYTLFARDDKGRWHEQVAVGLKPATEVHWSRDEAAAPGPSAARLAEMQQSLPGA